jgi:hypothetical protein
LVYGGLLFLMMRFSPDGMAGLSKRFTHMKLFTTGGKS